MVAGQSVTRTVTSTATIMAAAPHLRGVAVVELNPIVDRRDEGVNPRGEVALKTGFFGHTIGVKAQISIY